MTNGEGGATSERIEGEYSVPPYTRAGRIKLNIMDKNLNSYIDKIYLLENRCRLNTKDNFLEPFNLDTKDIIAIQNAGKKIAKFVGLNNLTFVISTIQQAKNVAGHIELNNNSDEGVFIEICESILKSKDAVLATLAHEISHKFLHIHNINCGIGPQYTYENEILTDITAVYTGLGKLMLNGCQWSSVHSERNGNTTTTTTETLKTGYLKIDQFATVYNIICAIRDTDQKLCKSNLKPDSLYAYESEKGKLKDLLTDLKQPDVLKKNIFEKFSNDKLKLQTELADIEHDINYINNSLINETQDYLNTEHKKIVNLESKIENSFKNFTDNYRLQLLELIRIKNDVSDSFRELDDKKSYLFRHKKRANFVANFMTTKNDLFLQPRNDMFQTVKCRNDQTTLKVPTGETKVKIKCPKCAYQFIVNSSKFLKKIGILSKFSGIFRKREKAIKGSVVTK